MRIEVGHHAPHRALHEAMIVHRLDVVLLDALEDLGEQPHVFPGQVVAAGVAACEHGTAERHDETGGSADGEEQQAAGNLRDIGCKNAGRLACASP